MGCLDGIVVLDLARRYPPAYAAMFLGDFGATVIKVDPPGVFLPLKREGFSEARFAAFYALDRNKRSIVLDLKNQAARSVFYRLVERADVLIEGFRPGVMDRLGVGYSRLNEINPRLIYCSLTGFGPDGPYADMPAHDMNYIALSGVLSLIGERNGRPYLPSNIIADFAGAGLHGTIGILLALIARSRTGRGQLVDISYLDASLSLLTATASDYFESGEVPRRGETPQTGSIPCAQVLKCQDGEYFTIGAFEPQFWANLCCALGCEYLIPEREASGERAEEVIGELAAIFKTRTRDEWFDYLKDKQTCAAPVHYLNETFADPQVIHREMVVELEHPTIGRVNQVGVSIKLSETPGQVRFLGVPTGADNDAVLSELGYSPEDLADLRARGAFGG